jgi:NADH dehydrogenase FAD-containing subunit
LLLQITLIDQGERFIFKPLLYELLNGTAQSWEVAPTFAQLLAPYTIQYLQVRGTAQQKQLAAEQHQDD